MASIPDIYSGNPVQERGGLTPMQLALADQMIKSAGPFGVNPDFLQAMKVYSSSEFLSPLDVDPKTGAARQPDLIRNITGLAYFVRGEDLYLFRRAQDCAMDEERYEEVWLGKVKDLATGTYAYYGRMVAAGTVSTGGGGWNGGGGGYGGPTGLSGGGGFAHSGLQGSKGFGSDGSIGGGTGGGFPAGGEGSMA